MELVIHSLHFNLNSKTESRLREKFGRLEKYYDRLISCHLILSHSRSGDGKNFLVEAKLELPGKRVFAEERAASFEVAAETVADALRDQVIQYKEQLQQF